MILRDGRALALLRRFVFSEAAGWTFDTSGLFSSTFVDLWGSSGPTAPDPARAPSAGTLAYRSVRLASNLRSCSQPHL